MPLLLSFAAILLLIALIVGLKLDTFISFIIVSICLGLACGMDIAGIGSSIKNGIGGTLGSLLMILVFGAMLGKIVADSGAAQQITTSLVRLCGVNNIQWAMALGGLLIGFPMFYTAAFVIVVPLIFATGMTTRLPLMYIGIPMIAALSVSHGFLPPHPSPTAISAQLGADLGKTLLYGLIAGIPIIALAGPIFARTLKKHQVTPNPDLVHVQHLPEDQLPGLGISLFCALLPLFLLTITTISNPFIDANSLPGKFIAFIGDANLAMMLSVLVAVYLLGIRRGGKMKPLMRQLEDAVKGLAPMLLIIAGSGIFMQVMKDGGMNTYIGESLKNLPLSPLVLGWTIAAIIRVCVGSATVAGLTAGGILLPLLHAPHTQPELMVLSIGAGSLMFSHVNDSGFWLFKEYFNLTLKQTFSTWSLMETIVSLAGLGGVLVLQQVLAIMGN
ncbi:gluconate:H+ symporter [Chitinophaga horti]|uniref:Gluconate:H+ symporter n=1 Tax=Chitinophaga horti TaxID=2920382 RepID=A0ABY6J473_9BACT|nr:gluconate:H+ symporter [Chitinophaga horti]UYQ93427.1 gluconate:H+ symporter [Chitinophaga horti]